MRPYVIVSAATSIDGYIDDPTAERLILSDSADLDRVDALRASCDAILVGAGTVRADDPRLQVRSAARRDQRMSAGLPGTPLRVVLGGHGRLDVTARVFVSTVGPRPLLLVDGGVVDAVRRRFSGVADVVATGVSGDAEHVLIELARRGVTRLLVEGGTSVNTTFLASGSVDELQLAVAPLFVGDSRAPRMSADASYPWRGARARLLELHAVGDMALVRWGLSDRAQLAPAGTADAPAGTAHAPARSGDVAVATAS